MCLCALARGFCAADGQLVGELAEALVPVGVADGTELRNDGTAARPPAGESSFDHSREGWGLADVDGEGDDAP